MRVMYYGMCNGLITFSEIGNAEKKVKKYLRPRLGNREYGVSVELGAIPSHKDF